MKTNANRLLGVATVSLRSARKCLQPYDAGYEFACEASPLELVARDEM